jgi:hypothetical protein
VLVRMLDASSKLERKRNLRVVFPVSTEEVRSNRSFINYTLYKHY